MTQGCEKPHLAKGMCAAHYYATKRNSPPPTPEHRCTVEDCTQQRVAKGMCRVHYARMRKTGTTAEPNLPVRDPICTVDGCGKPHLAKDMCSTHYYSERSRRRREARTVAHR